MCVFSGLKGTPIEGLMRDAGDMPLPLPDDGERFPGDILVGWKKMYTRDGLLLSSVYHKTWSPDRPMRAAGSEYRLVYPKFSREGRLTSDRGIYAWPTPFACAVRDSSVAVKVALWGVAIDFEGETEDKNGCMAQFAYPLEIHVSRDWPTVKLQKAFRPKNVRVYLHEPTIMYSPTSKKFDPDGGVLV